MSRTRSTIPLPSRTLRRLRGLLGTGGRCKKSVGHETAKPCFWRWRVMGPERRNPHSKCRNSNRRSEIAAAAYRGGLSHRLPGARVYCRWKAHFQPSCLPAAVWRITVPEVKSAGKVTEPSGLGCTVAPFTMADFTGPLPSIWRRRRPWRKRRSAET